MEKAKIKAIQEAGAKTRAKKRRFKSGVKCPEGRKERGRYRPCRHVSQSETVGKAPRAASVDVKPIADELVKLIISGRQDERLQWSAGGHVVPESSRDWVPKQTLEAQEPPCQGYGRTPSSPWLAAPRSMLEPGGATTLSVFGRCMVCTKAVCQTFPPAHNDSVLC